jgi:hypothetical protein
MFQCISVPVTLCHAYAGRGSVAVQPQPIRNLVVRIGKVVNTTPLSSRERHRTHCTGGWVGLGAVFRDTKKSRPHRESIPRPDERYTVHGILAASVNNNRHFEDRDLSAHEPFCRFLRLPHFILRGMKFPTKIVQKIQNIFYVQYASL